MPSFSAIYGAFAAVPILLLWIYLLWSWCCWALVIAAYLPSLLAGVAASLAERRAGCFRNFC
jgi:membrane protein